VVSNNSEVENKYYNLSNSSLADARTRVLKQNETFAVFDREGDIHPRSPSAQGVFHHGTRFLSQMEVTLAGQKPLLLSSNLREDNGILLVDMTNVDIYQGHQIFLSKGTIHLHRKTLLWGGCCHEKIEIQNFGNSPVTVPFCIAFDADFIDIFELRGMQRPAHGTRVEKVSAHEGIEYIYTGLDGVVRRTVIRSSIPTDILAGRFNYLLDLPPKGSVNISLEMAFSSNEDVAPGIHFDQAYIALSSKVRRDKQAFCGVRSSNEQFNQWLNRSLSDLVMMFSETESGIYPFAGIPWYCTPFGRDGIITALECLWVNPQIAKGVLQFLASTQAKEISAEQDAEPGKIVHETREGEMAALKEIPFGKYYGSIDSTPLFVGLAGAYYQRTDDLEFIRLIWPHIEAAIRWIDKYGDTDGDGFIEYCRHSKDGLIQQGWKDSHDSVFDDQGGIAPPPIALCEVQGYAYEAKLVASQLAAVLGKEDLSGWLYREAMRLKEKFLEKFWVPELNTYALALDGNKRPLKVRTSNAGHCLFSGIASKEHARLLVNTLFEQDTFSGWGLRTVSSKEIAFNPMSYHNGSVWPHDNAMIAHGLARYGFKDQVDKIFTGIFDATSLLEFSRLPELFCGFVRRHGEAPTLYPVACVPQAWSSGVVYYLLQACLGLHIDAPNRRVSFKSPTLPQWLDELHVQGLVIGAFRLSFSVKRHKHDASITITEKRGEFAVSIEKGLDQSWGDEASVDI